MSAPGLASCLVVPEFNCHICNSRRTLEGNQFPAPIGQELGSVPVGRRDDPLPGARGVCECSRYGLRLIAVRREVDIGGTNQRCLLDRPHVAILDVEDSEYWSKLIK